MEYVRSHPSLTFQFGLRLFLIANWVSEREWEEGERPGLVLVLLVIEMAATALVEWFLVIVVASATMGFEL